MSQKTVNKRKAAFDKLLSMLEVHGLELPHMLTVFAQINKRLAKLATHFDDRIDERGADSRWAQKMRNEIYTAFSTFIKKPWCVSFAKKFGPGSFHWVGPDGTAIIGLKSNPLQGCEFFPASYLEPHMTPDTDLNFQDFLRFAERYRTEGNKILPEVKQAITDNKSKQEAERAARGMKPKNSPRGHGGRSGARY